MPIKDIERRKEYQKEYNKKHYIKYKEKRISLTIKRRGEIKIFINLLKKDGCSLCDEKNIVCLDFHHLDRKTKEISLAQAGTHGWSNDRILKEIKKCVVLCSNCHRKVEAGVLPL